RDEYDRPVRRGHRDVAGRLAAAPGTRHATVRPICLQLWTGGRLLARSGRHASAANIAALLKQRPIATVTRGVCVSIVGGILDDRRTCHCLSGRDSTSIV